MQYQLQMMTLPWVSDIPQSYNGEGRMIVIANQSAPNMTNQLPVGQKFYLSGANTAQEDPSIQRTITSSVFDPSTNENIFTFTPSLAQTWTDTANITLLLQALPVAFKGYFNSNSSPTATSTMVLDCVNECRNMNN